MIFFIISMVLRKMHEFTLFRQGSVLNDYYYYQINVPQYYYFGCILGILAFGFLSDNVLKKRMYMTIVFVTTCQIIYTILSFVYDKEID